MVYLLDGGLGSELQITGVVKVGDRLWSARPLTSQDGTQRLKAVHLNFLRAGADVVKTASYQLSVDLLRECLPDLSPDQCLDVFRNSVRVARSACEEFQANGQKQVKVAGSVGPYGACLPELPSAEFHGRYVDAESPSYVTDQQLIDWHTPRIRTLVDCGVDFLAIETFPALTEALCVLQILHQVAPEQPSWISFSCKDEKHLCHGEEFASAVSAVWRNRTPGLAAVGVNCTHPKFIGPLLQTLIDARLDAVPVVVYPNSGEDWDRTVGYHGEGVAIDQLVADWLKIHPNIFAVGGCCRCRPEDIRRIKTLLH